MSHQPIGELGNGTGHTLRNRVQHPVFRFSLASHLTYGIAQDLVSQTYLHYEIIVKPIDGAHRVGSHLVILGHRQELAVANLQHIPMRLSVIKRREDVVHLIDGHLVRILAAGRIIKTVTKEEVQPKRTELQ